MKLFNNKKTVTCYIPIEKTLAEQLLELVIRFSLFVSILGFIFYFFG